MDISLLSLMSLGAALGMKNAVEPDHVTAVSTIAAKSRRIWTASLAGVFWGIGHTAALFAVGMLLILTKSEIPDGWAKLTEFCVGVMIVVLGISSLLDLRRREPANERQEPREKTAYWKTLMIGVVHGFAGSAAMVLLTMSLMRHVWEGALFILVFGLGTVAGMLLTTTVIGMPFALTSGKIRLNRALAGLAGAFSVAFGLYYMFETGVHEILVAHWPS